MKIIVTVPYAPWPVTRGTGRLIVNLLEGLSKRHETTLVTMTLSREELGRLRELEKPGIRVRAMVAPHRRGASGRLLSKVRNLAGEFARGVPREVGYDAPAGFLRLIADEAEARRADLVLASYWHMYRLPGYVRSAKLVLVTHDLDYMISRESSLSSGGDSGRGGTGETGADEGTNGKGKSRRGARARRLERIELEAYRRFDTILTVTPSDAEMLRREPFAEGKRIMPLPLALDLSVFSPSAFERKTGRILLLGSFHSDFNRDALLYFTSDVFPAVRREVPGAVLEVVGHGVDDHIKGTAGDGVEFTGGVDDIAPYLGECSLMVLPLRFGGGVRIRMMEAAAMGTAVVSTPVGVAGMGLAAGRDYLEAVDADSMASSIVSLLRDPARARGIGANARRWAESNISMDDYPDRLDAMLAAVLDNRGGGVL